MRGRRCDCSPHAAKRNAGPLPDCASLHPGYEAGSHRHRQIEQPAKRPAADAHRLALIEPQAPSAAQTRSAAPRRRSWRARRQRPRRNAGPRRTRCSCAVSRVRSNWSASAKCASSRLAEPNIRNTRSSTAKSTPFTVAALAMRRGDMPIGEIQRANSSNTASHDTAPSRTRANSSRMRQQRPDAAGDRLARLVLPARDRELDVVAHVLFRHAAVDHHAEQRVVRRFAHRRAACR